MTLAEVNIPRGDLLIDSGVPDAEPGIAVCRRDMAGFAPVDLHVARERATPNAIGQWERSSAAIPYNTTHSFTRQWHIPFQLPARRIWLFTSFNTRCPLFSHRFTTPSISPTSSDDNGAPTLLPVLLPRCPHRVVPALQGWHIRPPLLPPPLHAAPLSARIKTGL